MRQIVLDTETTGLSPKDGHRIIEITVTATLFVPNATAVKFSLVAVDSAVDYGRYANLIHNSAAVAKAAGCGVKSGVITNGAVDYSQSTPVVDSATVFTCVMANSAIDYNHGAAVVPNATAAASAT